MVYSADICQINKLIQKLVWPAFRQQRNTQTLFNPRQVSYFSMTLRVSYVKFTTCTLSENKGRPKQSALCTLDAGTLQPVTHLSQTTKNNFSRHAPVGKCTARSPSCEWWGGEGKFCVAPVHKIYVRYLTRVTFSDVILFPRK